MSDIDNKRYYWLRLKNDFFSSLRIKKLRKLGSDFVIIYLKMQLISLKDDGLLYYKGVEKTFAEEIALEIDEDLDKVQLTLAYLQSCDLLESSEDGEYFLPYVKENTGSETGQTQRKRIARHNKKMESGTNLVQCTANVPQVYQKCTPEKEIEKELEIEIEKELEIKSKDIVEQNSTLPRQVIDYLNGKLGSNYKSTNKETQKHIKARQAEGYVLEDFILVIDKMYVEWGKDAKMKAYLRPQTLFGPKFESYLNREVKATLKNIECDFSKFRE